MILNESKEDKWKKTAEKESQLKKEFLKNNQKNIEKFILKDDKNGEDKIPAHRSNALKKLRDLENF